MEEDDVECMFYVTGLVHPLDAAQQEYGFILENHELQKAAEILEGKPVFCEHDYTRRFGTCRNLYVDPQVGLIGTCEIPIRKGDYLAKDICAKIWTHELDGFSFGQLSKLEESILGPAVVGITPWEVSVVGKPGIDGALMYNCGYYRKNGDVLKEKVMRSPNFNAMVRASKGSGMPIREVEMDEVPPQLKSTMAAEPTLSEIAAAAPPPPPAAAAKPETIERDPSAKAIEAALSQTVNTTDAEIRRQKEILEELKAQTAQLRAQNQLQQQQTMATPEPESLRAAVAANAPPAEDPSIPKLSAEEIAMFRSIRELAASQNTDAAGLLRAAHDASVKQAAEKARLEEEAKQKRFTDIKNTLIELSTKHMKNEEFTKYVNPELLEQLFKNPQQFDTDPNLALTYANAIRVGATLDAKAEVANQKAKMDMTIQAAERRLQEERAERARQLEILREAQAVEADALAHANYLNPFKDATTKALAASSSNVVNVGATYGGSRPSVPKPRSAFSGGLNEAMERAKRASAAPPVSTPTTLKDYGALGSALNVGASATSVVETYPRAMPDGSILLGPPTKENITPVYTPAMREAVESYRALGLSKNYMETNLSTNDHPILEKLNAITAPGLIDAIRSAPTRPGVDPIISPAAEEAIKKNGGILEVDYGNGKRVRLTADTVNVYADGDFYPVNRDHPFR